MRTFSTDGGADALVRPCVSPDDGVRGSTSRAFQPPSMSLPRRRRQPDPTRGFTLMELVVAAMILSILTLGVIPLVHVQIKRERERELRQALWQMRDAIDRYKDAADRNAFQTKVDSQGYPPDLDTLYKGVEISGGKKLRFLRSIPTDPMTNSKDWGLRSMQDDPDSDSWGGQSVFDVYTKSPDQALDGTKYKDW